MKTYEVILSPKTKLTKLHSSQQLFGFFCYLILDNYGQSFLEETLDNINNGNNELRISSIMPDKTLFWPSLEINYSSQDKFDSVIAKQLKHIKYVSEKALKDIVDHEYKGDLLVKAIKSKKYEIDKDLLMYKKELPYDYDLGIDIRYSSKEETIYNVKSYQIVRQSKFRFFIETDINEFKDLLNKTKIYSLGKNKNTGLNIYELVKIEEKDLKRNHKNILLSKYIPKHIDAEINRKDSLCKIELAYTKPENRMFDIYDTEVLDQFSTIQEGSIIHSKQDNIGQLKLRQEATKRLKKNVYYNGIAFLYPMEV